jgi:glycosidase
MHNPAVRAEIRRIMGYWLELGVAGFRVDAVPFIIEPPTYFRKKFAFEFRIPAGNAQVSAMAPRRRYPTERSQCTP